MKIYKKLLIFILFLIWLIAFLSILKPDFIYKSQLSGAFENENLNTFLVITNTTITILLFFIQDGQDKKDTFLDFHYTTADLEPGTDIYERVSPSVFQIIKSKDLNAPQSFYCIYVWKDEKAKHPLLTTFEATIITKIDVTDIKFSNLKVELLDENNCIENLNLSPIFQQVFWDLEKVYQNNGKISLGFLFFLDEAKYNNFKDKTIVIKFNLHFTNMDGQKTRKKVQLKIYNSEYGLRFLGQSQ